MTVIYTIGQGSIWDNNELRYSLRSLALCKGVSEVIIAGYCPEWVNRSAVTHIYVGDEYSCAHKNILHKILTAAKECSGDFVVMSDDHILLRCFDFDHLPLYHKGLVKDEHENTYQISLSDTARFLQKEGLPWYATNLHFPKLYTREAYNRCLTLFHDSFAYRYGLEPSVLIGNVQIAMGMQYKYHKDNKTETPKAGAAFCSLMPNVSQRMSEFLADRFPKKSIFEL